MHDAELCEEFSSRTQSKCQSDFAAFSDYSGVKNCFKQLQIEQHTSIKPAKRQIFHYGVLHPQAGLGRHHLLQLGCLRVPPLSCCDSIDA
jgi:hypothetical protein